MSELFLTLDFLVPLLVLFYGRRAKGSLRHFLIPESLATLTAALLFAPLVSSFFPLSVQGAFCALLLLSLSASVSLVQYCKIKKGL